MKPVKDRQSVAYLNWHPNFINTESLPDIKVVRTDFFVSLISISIALVAIVLVLSKEQQAKQIEASILDLQREVDSRSAEHKLKIGQNDRFREAADDIEKIHDFVSGRMMASDFFLQTASALHDSMALSSLKYSVSGIFIQGVVEAGPKEAAEHVDEYMKTLEEMKVDQGLFTRYDLVSLERQTESGKMNFEISIK